MKNNILTRVFIGEIKLQKLDPNFQRNEIARISEDMKNFKPTNKTHDLFEHLIELEFNASRTSFTPLTTILDNVHKDCEKLAEDPALYETLEL